MKINTLAGWFGSNRTLAATVGQHMGRLRWCGVPFCGGCPELPHIDCASGLAADLHDHVINMARVVRDTALCEMMIKLLEGMLFHPTELEESQRRCQAHSGSCSGLFGGERVEKCEPDPIWAAHYFVACWMGRGGHAGKRSEFSQGLAVRFTSSGGDSVVRYRNAIASLPAWRQALNRWQFQRLCAFDFLDRAQDESGHGLYLDPPWPDAGQEYQHSFSDTQHMRMEARLRGYERVRIVVRLGDHPLIRRLYSSEHWNWVEQHSVNQQGGEVKEVLLVRWRRQSKGC